MKFVIIGTAGHIDHGKSSLVKALTGIDPDRLPEEKEREITIDLGFAHMVMDGITIGFIDVPGHVRFVRNMLAGIGGVDAFLMAVSAVEGIREQTREHGEILRLLGIRTGIVAVTKVDLPDARPEIYDSCSKYFNGLVGGDFTVIGTSVSTDSGIGRLHEELLNLARRLPERAPAGVFRHNIDRVFSLRGAGTIVTGTAVSGQIRVGQDVEVLPGGPTSRVRQIQVYGGPVDEARVGQRVALNLHGIERAELRRGQVAVSPPGSLLATRRFIALAEEAGIASRALRHGERVRVCAGSAEVLGRCYLLAGKELEPGSPPVFSEIRLEDPLLVLQGDPFILRSFSPVETHGGGRVVDNLPDRPVRKHFVSDLEQLAAGELEPLVRLRGHAGLPLEAIVQRAGRRPDEEHLRRWLGDRAVLVGEGKQQRLVWAEALERLESSIVKKVEAFHAANPLKPGLPLRELYAQMKLDEPVTAPAIERLVNTARLKVSAGTVALAGFSVQLRPEESGLRGQIETLFKKAGRRPLELSELLATTRQPATAVLPFVSMLLNEKRLLRVAQDIWIHADGLLDLAQALRAFKQRKPRISVGEFKDLSATTRKLAIPLLEFLDRQRLTRRDKDERIIL
ncbi:MAG: selenocysteine-specific translation elongation factor [Acidobacteriota bacterium]